MENGFQAVKSYSFHIESPYHSYGLPMGRRWSLSILGSKREKSSVLHNDVGKWFIFPFHQGGGGRGSMLMSITHTHCTYCLSDWYRTHLHVIGSKTLRMLASSTWYTIFTRRFISRRMIKDVKFYFCNYILYVHVCRKNFLDIFIWVIIATFVWFGVLWGLWAFTFLKFHKWHIKHCLGLMQHNLHVLLIRLSFLISFCYGFLS
jgi:hypothetical protein